MRLLCGAARSPSTDPARIGRCLDDLVFDREDLRPEARGTRIATCRTLAELLERRAAERELKRWFSWQWYWDDAIVDELVAERRVGRIDGYVTTAGTPS
jgi:hypothetical protein